jgi:Ca2+-binding EF-hand superfamily protein
LPLDILKFLRECNVHEYHEADCYYLLKFFDADEDGALCYADFLQIILPVDNELLRAVATQKPNELYIKEIEKELPEEVERELAALIVLELELHRKTEPLK